MIDYFQLTIDYLMHAIDFKFVIVIMIERHAAQAPALRERLPEIVNYQ
jgi:hypothetical protein